MQAAEFLAVAELGGGRGRGGEGGVVGRGGGGGSSLDHVLLAAPLSKLALQAYCGGLMQDRVVSHGPMIPMIRMMPMVSMTSMMPMTTMVFMTVLYAELVEVAPPHPLPIAGGVLVTQRQVSAGPGAEACGGAGAGGAGCGCHG